MQLKVFHYLILGMWPASFVGFLLIEETFFYIFNATSRLVKLYLKFIKQLPIWMKKPCSK